MAFSQTIKEQALVAAARRCCLGQRFRGVGVEVHHIVPTSMGGADSFDNAIVLCFDCHCAAGHYNIHHPRGTRFSSSELRKHRDAWYERVKATGPPPVDLELPEHYIRHVIGLDAAAVDDFVNLKRDSIPFGVTLLWSNQILDYMRVVLADKRPHDLQNSGGFSAYSWASSPPYDTKEDLLAAHAEFRGKDSRPLGRVDIGKRGMESRIFSQAIAEGTDPYLIGEAVIEPPGCGSEWSYIYKVRKPVFVFCEMCNRSDLVLKVIAVLSRRSVDHGAKLRSLEYERAPLDRISMAPAFIRPGENVFIPEMVLYGPLNTPIEFAFYESRSMEEPKWNEQNVIAYRSSAPESAAGYHVSGPTMYVEGFEVELPDGSSVELPVHRFDPANCYMFYRAWAMGSCPHVYVYTDVEGWTYGGEILQSAQGRCRRGTTTLLLSSNTRRCRIVELEPEISYLASITG